jgi:hypothetical protein
LGQGAVVQFETEVLLHSSSIIYQDFWRLEMYALDDIAALMKSVMEDTTGAAVALRNEQPVAHVTSLFPALIYCNIWLLARLRMSPPTSTLG